MKELIHIKQPIGVKYKNKVSIKDNNCFDTCVKNRTAKSELFTFAEVTIIFLQAIVFINSVVIHFSRF